MLSPGVHRCIQAAESLPKVVPCGDYYDEAKVDRLRAEVKDHHKKYGRVAHENPKGRELVIGVFSIGHEGTQLDSAKTAVLEHLRRGSNVLLLCCTSQEGSRTTDGREWFKKQIAGEKWSGRVSVHFPRHGQEPPFPTDEDVSFDARDIEPEAATQVPASDDDYRQYIPPQIVKKPFPEGKPTAPSFRTDISARFPLPGLQLKDYDEERAQQCCSWLSCCCRRCYVSRPDRTLDQCHLRLQQVLTWGAATLWMLATAAGVAFGYQRRWYWLVWACLVVLVISAVFILITVMQPTACCCPAICYPSTAAERVLLLQKQAETCSRTPY